MTFQRGRVEADRVEFVVDLRRAADAALTGVKATGGLITFLAKASLADTDYFTIDGRLHELDVAGDGGTAGRIVTDVSGATSAADVAALVLPDLVNTHRQHAFTDNLDGTIGFVAKFYGTVGNVAVSDNVADAGFTVAAPSGGLDPSFAHTATETIKTFTVPAGQRFRVDACVITNPAGLAEHAANYWEIALLDDAAVMAQWSTAAAAEGTLPADTASAMTITSPVAAAGSVISLKLTKVASAADLPPGRVHIRGRYL